MRMIIAAALALLPALAAAQPGMPTEAPGKPDPKVVTKGRYAIEPDHTQVIFTVNHLGFTEYSGMFTNPKGTLTLDPANPAAAKIEVTFPIAGVRTTVTALDEAIQKADLLDAAKFPTATFVSTKIVVAGSNATIAGNLTLHGVTKPVTLKARFIGAGREFWGDKKMAFGFEAGTTIKRSDFGITASIPLVGDRVDLHINAGFVAM